MLHRYRVPFWLLVGDLLTLLAFIYIGQRDHELLDASSPFVGLLLPSAVFALPWGVAAWALRALPRGDDLRFWPFMGRSLNVWLVAAPLELLLRSWVLGRAVIPTAFFNAALGFGGLMILGWRAIFAIVYLWLRQRKHGSSSPPLPSSGKAGEVRPPA